MPAFLENRKLVFGAGLGVAIAASTCAFAAYLWYDRKNRKITAPSPKLEQKIVQTDEDLFAESTSPACSSSETEEESTVEIMAENRRGGRVNYRRQAAQHNKESSPKISESSPAEKSSNIINKSADIRTSVSSGKSISWSEEVEREQMDSFSEGFRKYCRTEADGKEAEDASRVVRNQHQHHQPISEDEEEVRRVLSSKQQQTGTSFVSQISPGAKQPHPIESPSVASDIQSETSQDSGRGGSTGVASSMSPVEEIREIEPPPFYEFEIPQGIVGLIIGKKGVTIKQLTERSGAHIVIREHWFKDNFKICTLEGTRDQINVCLRTIRRMFPPSRFPELNLNPLLPPPVTSPVTSMWESLIRLSLPDGVRTEAVVSSMVDAGHVFVQQPTHPSFQYLAKLDQFMLAVYSGQTTGVPQLPKPIELGVICAAPVLGGWYRAQTMCYYEDDDEVLVRFEDYGGYSRMPSSDLRQIRSDFMNIPFQATECYMAHITPVEEEGWSIEACELLSQLAMTSVIEAKVVKYAPDGLPMVELFCTQDGQEFDINKTLALEGFAKYVNEDSTDTEGATEE